MVLAVQVPLHCGCGGNPPPLAWCCPAVWVRGHHCHLVLPMLGDTGDSEVHFGAWLPASNPASLLLEAHLVDGFCLSCMDLSWLDTAPAGRGLVVCTGTWSVSG